MNEEIWKWVMSRPPAVRKVACRLATGACLRSTENKGHYILHSIDEEIDDPSVVTVTMIHGADSFAPGFRVFGVDPDTITVCGCGEWEWPSAKQAEAFFTLAETAMAEEV